jgi:hypothetical protein
MSLGRLFRVALISHVSVDRTRGEDKAGREQGATLTPLPPAQAPPIENNTHCQPLTRYYIPAPPEFILTHPKLLYQRALASTYHLMEASAW